MHGEIFVDGFRLSATVPVMELGSGGLCDLSSHPASAKYSGSWEELWARDFIYFNLLFERNSDFCLKKLRFLFE